MVSALERERVHTGAAAEEGIVRGRDAIDQSDRVEEQALLDQVALFGEPGQAKRAQWNGGAFGRPVGVGVVGDIARQLASDTPT